MISTLSEPSFTTVLGPFTQATLHTLWPGSQPLSTPRDIEVHCSGPTLLHRQDISPVLFMAECSCWKDPGPPGTQCTEGHDIDREQSGVRRAARGWATQQGWGKTLGGYAVGHMLLSPDALGELQREGERDRQRQKQRQKQIKRQ